MIISIIEFIISSLQSFINNSLNNDIGQMFLSLFILSGGIIVAKSILFLLKSSTTK